jgi:N-formylglutamate amidohydrolase
MNRFIDHKSINTLIYLLFFLFIGCEDSKESKEIEVITPVDTTKEEVFPELGYDGPYQSGNAYYGRESYIEYHAGNLPIIFSAPHGGRLTPDEINDRTYGTLVTDDNTYELTKTIMDSMVVRFGGYPHVILCKLKRTKLDANRDSTEAAQENRYALRAWQEYHHYIKVAKEKIVNDQGSGLFFDIHGHGKNPDGFYDLRTWLGYLISSDELDQSDETLNTNSYQSKSSISSWVDSSSYTFIDVLRGSVSFGSILDSLGYKSLPSVNDPSPSGMRYFSGGYNTARHGSRNGGVISAIQIELPKPGIRENQSTWSNYSKSINSAINEYYTVHLNRNIKD